MSRDLMKDTSRETLCRVTSITTLVATPCRVTSSTLIMHFITPSHLMVTTKQEMRAESNEKLTMTVYLNALKVP